MSSMMILESVEIIYDLYNHASVLLIDRRNVQVSTQIQPISEARKFLISIMYSLECIEPYFIIEFQFFDRLSMRAIYIVCRSQKRLELNVCGCESTLYQKTHK